MKFEFDPAKSESNLIKHGIDFLAVQELWKSIRLEVPAKSVEGETRYAVLGRISGTHHTVIIPTVATLFASLALANPQPMKQPSMSTKQKNPKTRAISTAEFDARFEAGEDIVEHLDLHAARVFAPGEARLDLTPTKVNVDFPKWMVESLDTAADRVGVPRQSLIKLWLSERLEKVSSQA